MKKIKREVKKYFLAVLFMFVITAVFIFLVYGIAELIQSF